MGLCRLLKKVELYMNIEVPGTGPLTATIAIVGEAPGETEAKLGKPFVGESGKKLTQLLDRAGIIRETCYITNVFKFRPLGNDLTPYLRIGTKEAKESQEYLESKAYLASELAALPILSVIIAVGNVSLYTLTGLTKIMKRRGSVYSHPDGFRIVPIIHPAAILRARGASDVAQSDPFMLEYYTVEDLRKAKTISDGNYTEIKRNYIINPSLDQIFTFIADLTRARKPVAFDIETSMKTYELLSIAISNCPEEAMCIPFRNSYGDFFTEENEIKVMAAISHLLENPNILKIAHNATFDCAFMLRKYGIKAVPIFDTMLAHKVLCPDFPKSLEFIASMLAKMPYWKDEGKDGYSQAGKLHDTFWEYNCKDVMVLHEIKSEIETMIATQGNTETLAAQMDLIEPLLYMQARGVKIDQAGLSNLIEETVKEIEELKKDFAISTNEYLNPNQDPVSPTSPTQVATYFYDTRGITAYTHRKTKKPTTDITALKRLARRGYKEASILIDIRRKEKLRSSYADSKLIKNGRLHSNFAALASTGRLTSSELMDGSGTNMENMPPKITEFLYCDEGYLGFYFDLSNADNRTVAYIAPEPRMISAFESGIDIHSQTYGLMYGIPIEEVSSEDGSSPLGDGTKSQRFWGKKTNHSFNFGLGHVNYSLDAEIPEKEGKNHRERYHRVYPGLKDSYFRWVEETIRKTRSLVNSYGRRRKFLGRMDYNLLLQGFAFIPQSNTADTINRRGINFIHNDQKNFRWIELLNQVHDSIWFQIPLHIGFSAMSEMLSAIKTSLETPLEWKNYKFSIPAELKAGICFGKLWKTTPESLREDYERNKAL